MVLKIASLAVHAIMWANSSSAFSHCCSASLRKPSRTFSTRRWYCSTSMPMQWWWLSAIAKYPFVWAMEMWESEFSIYGIRSALCMMGVSMPKIFFISSRSPSTSFRRLSALASQRALNPSFTHISASWLDDSISSHWCITVPSANDMVPA